jgi:hypothetical protein
MYQDFPRGVGFWSFLLRVDRNLAETARQRACPCGGRLHRANYPRQPRGGPDHLSQEDRLRFSFCCDRDGCRKRVTPPSVRFLGPKVYLGVVVILVAAMRHGPSPRRVGELCARFGVNRRTIARWKVFWEEHLPQTPFWKVKRGRFLPPLEVAALPWSLLDRFLPTQDPCQGWGRLLKFLSPITIGRGLSLKGLR